MKFIQFFVLLIGILFISNVCGFQNSVNRLQNISRNRKTSLEMSGKMSKFGIFSPAVYVAKFALGESKLNKLRGKAISLHSQAITEWCVQFGAYNLRLKLIKKAKKNGDELGFLV